jgi:hypothetical protein
MESLTKKIREARPNIKDISLNTYLRNLKKINSELEGESDYSLKILEDKSKVQEFLDQRKESTQKNYLASFVVLLSTDMEKHAELIETYRNQMEALGEDLLKQYKSQEKTEAQKENWASLESLRGVVKDYKKEIDKKNLLNKKDLTRKEFDLIQKWVVGNLYTLDPENNPPLRADYGEMQIIHISDYNKLKEEEKKKNYLVIKGKIKKFFHLGEYKTSGKYGSKLIRVGSKLNSILNKWLKINTTGFLLVNSKNKPLNPNQLSKYTVKTFEPLNKKIGINILRHVIISHLFPPQLEKRNKTADLMGHSNSQQELYAKK